MYKCAEMIDIYKKRCENQVDGKFFQRINILVIYHDLEPLLENSGYGPATYYIRTLYVYVTGFWKTVPNRTFGISRNTNFKYSWHCISLVLDCSHARLAPAVD